MPANRLGVRVKAEEDTSVDEWILLLCPRAFLSLLTSLADDGLDFTAVDNTCDVRVADLGGGQAAGRPLHQCLAVVHIYPQVILFEGGRLVECAEDFVQKTERTLRPYDKPSNMATRSELKEVKSSHIDELNAGQISKRFDNAIIFIVHHKRATTLSMSPVPHFAFTRSVFAGVGNFDDVPVGFESLEKGNGFFGFLERFDGTGDD